MKELNVTEAQLRSWRPRRPAAGLKQKILTADTAMPTAKWLWGGLAPTMACVLLTLMAFNHDGGALGVRPMMTIVLSNQSYAAYVSGGEQTAQNHLAAVSFDSTNYGGFRSITGFTPTTNFSN
jgi:hypothetical protein